ncbi:hypothetical protein ACFLQN_02220 [Candidatus Aenigmatarchaeota archaeon]
MAFFSSWFKRGGSGDPKAPKAPRQMRYNGLDPTAVIAAIEGIGISYERTANPIRAIGYFMPPGQSRGCAMLDLSNGLVLEGDASYHDRIRGAVAPLVRAQQGAADGGSDSDSGRMQQSS